jgi:hypothetical protein
MITSAVLAAGIQASLTVVSKIASIWGSRVVDTGIAPDNLIDYTRVSRVEPVVLIDADCLYYDNLTEVQQSLLSIFAGYYLQAVALSMTIGKVNVLQHLDKINPTRDMKTALIGAYGAESFQDRLPVPYELALEAKPPQELAEERFEYEKRKEADALKEREAARMEDKYRDNRDTKMKQDKSMFDEVSKIQEFKDRHETSEFGIGRDTLSTLKEISNLSVGKLFSVDITDGIHKASIPIQVRLLANVIPTNSLIHILSINGQDKLETAKERYHGWKSGRLEFWRDLIFCQDVIDAHRTNLMKDKEGIYSNIVQRNRNNSNVMLASMSPSLANASNLVVTTTDAISKLELHLDGKFDNFKIREKLFKETYLMIVAVIDKQMDRVTFYHRGIHLPTECSMRDLKSSNKGAGPDVSDVLKAYQLGNAPSL